MRRQDYPVVMLGALLAAASACSGAPDASDDYRGPAPFPDRRTQFATHGGLLGYVANRYSDTVSVVDLDAMTELGAAPVGRDPVDIDGPRHILLDRERGLAYVALSYPLKVESPHAESSSDSDRAGYVQALALGELAPVGELRVDPDPDDLALSTTGELAVSHYDAELALATSSDIDERRANLGLVDPASAIAGAIAEERRIRVCVAPASVVYGRNGARAYVACTGEDSLGVVDTASGAVLSRVAAGTGAVNKPYALTVEPSGTRLLLSNEVAGVVAVFTTEDPPAPIATVTLTGIPFFSGWISDSEFVVPIQSPSGAARVDAASGSIAQQIAYADGECDNPSDVEAAPDGRVFMVCEGDHYGPGSIVRIDPMTLAVTARVSVGIYPDRLAILPP